MTHLRRRLLLVAIALPLIITAVGLGLMIGWYGQVPDPIVMHWTLDRPNGYAPRWIGPVLLAVVGIAIPLGIGLPLVRARRVGGLGQARILGVVPVFVVTVLTVIQTWSFGVQRGLTDAAAEASILPGVITGFAAGLLLAIAGWFALPRTSTLIPEGTPARPLTVAAQERVIWIGAARPAIGATVLLSVALALVAGACALLVGLYGLRAAVVLLPIILVVLASVLGVMSWRVRIDEAGLTIRGLLGWPIYRYPLDRIASAATREIAPLGDFGGYGMRFASPGRMGLITRAGEALEVKLANGRTIIITVDDAATSASLLEGLRSSH